MICSSANWRTMSQIARCSSVLSSGLAATAMSVSGEVVVRPCGSEEDYPRTCAIAPQTDVELIRWFARWGGSLRAMSNDRFAVSVKDAAGAYVRANDAFTNLLGVSSADLPGLTDDHVQPRDVAETLVANDRAALAAAGTLLVEEQVFDRLGLRKVVACRFTTEEDGRVLVWRVSGPIQQAAEISAEAERLRMAVTAPEQPEDEPVPAPAPVAAVVAPPVPEPVPLPVIDDSADRIARLEAELAEVRSKAELPDPRMQAALRALAGVAEALEQPMRVAPAFRAAAERLGSALGFDAVVTWRPGRDGGMVCSSVWTANPDARSSPFGSATPARWSCWPSNGASQRPRRSRRSKPRPASCGSWRA